MRTPNFNTVAASYRWLEYGAFGRALWRRRIRYLSECRGSKRVLMLGEGDGRFLLAFLAADPEARVDYYDASPRMLQLAQRRCEPFADRVRFVLADARITPFPPRTYDLIVTHFVLDCFSANDLKELISHLSAAACEKSVWVVSEFQVPQHAWLGPLARATIRMLYVFFRITTGLRVTSLTPHEDFLRKVGFVRQEREQAMGGLLLSELWRK